MKELKDLNVKYVLEPFSQKQVKAGAAACGDCAIAAMGLVAGSLEVTVVIHKYE